MPQLRGGGLMVLHPKDKHFEKIIRNVSAPRHPIVESVIRNAKL